MTAPLYQSTTFARRSLEDADTYSYSRVSNPTVSALESALAALEGAAHAIAFASGMSATTALFLAHARPGREIVCSEQVYGGTSRLIDEILIPLGVTVRRVDGRDLEAFRRAIGDATALVFVETPSNPGLDLTDLDGLGRICAAHGVPLAVDNTFLGPLGLDAARFGVGIRLQSTTKYVDGHNATIGGVIATDDGELATRLLRIRKTLGLNQKPFEAWLTLQGLRTIELRFERQCATAELIARFLDDRPECRRVIHPSLPSHPQFELARRQNRLQGAIVSFELAGDAALARRFLARLERISLAENLGASQSLITHPASMTHADLGAERREALGITDGLLRLSVGIEGPEALISDLALALEGARSHE